MRPDHSPPRDPTLAPPQEGVGRKRGLTTRHALFAAATGLSATLLFSVQPIVGKLVLPRFGGSAATWAVVSAFFQVMLFLGYAYAHALGRWMCGRAQLILHAGVLLAGFAALPLTIPPAPADLLSFHETIHLAFVLAVGIGAPTLAIAAHAPLLQLWFSRSSLINKYQGAETPYFLYAISNFFSFLVLVTYPTILEPSFSLTIHRGAWQICYALLAVIVVACGWQASARRDTTGPVDHGPTKIEPRKLLIWIGLAALPSALLDAITQHISAEIAATPLIWIIPLAVYLASFVVAFANETRMGHGDWPIIALLLAGLLLGLATLGARGPFAYITSGTVAIAALYAIALTLHRQLFFWRPEAEKLTAYYMALAFGGALGGSVTALLSPVVFSWVAELPIILLLSLITISAIALSGSKIQEKFLIIIFALISMVIAVVSIVFQVDQREERLRSFYAVHRIVTTSDNKYRELWNGRTLHGAEIITKIDPPEPLTYYHADSMFAEVIDAARENKKDQLLRIGVVGLGTGAIACLAEFTDELTFLEIDPRVEEIARTRFRQISGCAPQARVLLGDAWLSLAADKAGPFDLLVLDAFSSDSVPVHLLTQEALRIAMQRLVPGGMLLVHISNDTLELASVLAAAARAEGWAFRFVEDEREDPGQRIFGSEIAVLARSEANLGRIATAPDWVRPDAFPVVAPWTDDYADIVGALWRRLRERFS